VNVWPPGLTVFSVGDTDVVVVVVVVVVVGLGDSPLLPQPASKPLVAISALIPSVALRRRTICEFIVTDAMAHSVAAAGVKS
jgi:hypothetical protein